MALVDLLTDLENFKYGNSPAEIDAQIQSGVDFFPNDGAEGFTTYIESKLDSNFETQYSNKQPDLDAQILCGVDFFPNDDAEGFTTSTNLETFYKKALGMEVKHPGESSGFTPTYYAGLNPITPRGSIFRDSEGNYQVPQEGGNTLPPGSSYLFPKGAVSGILPFLDDVTAESMIQKTFAIGEHTIDTQFGNWWNSPTVSGAYGSGFMITPLDNYISRLPVEFPNPVPNVSLYSQTFIVDNFDTSYNIFSQFGSSFLIPFLSDAAIQPFNLTPLSDDSYLETIFFNKPSPTGVGTGPTANFPNQITLTGPFQEIYQSTFDDYMRYGDDAHNIDDALSRLAGYIGLYPESLFTPSISSEGLGTFGGPVIGADSTIVSIVNDLGRFSQRSYPYPITDGADLHDWGETFSNEFTRFRVDGHATDYTDMEGSKFYTAFGDTASNSNYFNPPFLHMSLNISPFQQVSMYDVDGVLLDTTEANWRQGSIHIGSTDSPATHENAPTHTKQRGVFELGTSFIFEHKDNSIPYDNVVDILGKSIHISPSGEIEAGSEYMVVPQGTPLIDLASSFNPPEFAGLSSIGQPSYWEGGSNSTVYSGIDFLPTGQIQITHNINQTLGYTISNVEDGIPLEVLINDNRKEQINELFEFTQPVGFPEIFTSIPDTDGRTFKHVPLGLGPNNVPKYGNYRDVSDPWNGYGGFRQPFILRPIPGHDSEDQMAGPSWTYPGRGNWGVDPTGADPENPLGQFFSGVDEVVGGFVRGAPTFTGLIERNFTDKLRITKFLISTAGVGFMAKQVALQFLNPTIESRAWNPLSVLGISTSTGDANSTGDGLRDTLESVLASIALPISHPERHRGGGRYSDVNPITTIPDFLLDRLPGKVKQWIKKKGPDFSESFGFPLSRMMAQTNPEILELIEIPLLPQYRIGGGIKGGHHPVSWDDYKIGFRTAVIFANPNKFIGISGQGLSPSFIGKDGSIDFFNNLGTGDGSSADREARRIINTPGGTFNFNSKFGKMTLSQNATLRNDHANVQSSETLYTKGLKIGTDDYRSLGKFLYAPWFSTDKNSYGNVDPILTPKERMNHSYHPYNSFRINDSPGAAGHESMVTQHKIHGLGSYKEFKVSSRTENLKHKVAGVGDQGKGDIGERFEAVENFIGNMGKANGMGFGMIKGSEMSDNVDKVNISAYDSIVDGEKIYLNPSSMLPVKDFIKFRFYDAVNQKYIIFRAILSGISDSISTEYSSERYIGRPDKLHVYQGANRTVGFSFKLYPKTAQELPQLMTKLNYLVGLCYPTYVGNNRMASPFIELTIGDMFRETPGILESVNVTVEDESTWEIQDGLQYPHYITVQCNFIHIGRHAPVTQGKHYELPWMNAAGLHGILGTTQAYKNTYAALQAHEGIYTGIAKYDSALDAAIKKKQDRIQEAKEWKADKDAKEAEAIKAAAEAKFQASLPSKRAFWNNFVVGGNWNKMGIGVENVEPNLTVHQHDSSHDFDPTVHFDHKH